jgi:hypothetical protein
MATQHQWSRRQILAAAAGGVALSPFVPLLEGDAHAQAAIPKRLIVWFYPNGTLPGAYFPTTTGSNFEMTPILKPLLPYRDKLLVLKGIRLNAYDGGVKIVHISCVAPLLTGFTVPDGEHNEGSARYGWAAGPSVDQVVAAAIGGQTRFPSLEFHNIGMDEQYRTQYRVIYKAAKQPITGMRDPRLAFTRIFSDTTNDVLKLSRLGVLDQVKVRLDRLRGRVGAADRFKIDAHVDALVSLQKRVGTESGKCTPPAISFGANVPAGNCEGVGGKFCAFDTYYPELGKAYIDLMVQSFACDLTRVASLQWGAGGRGSSFPFFPDGASEHLTSHRGLTEPQMSVSDGLYMRMKRWYMEQLAYLIEKLKSVPEGNGTMFDNTLILACSEHGLGAAHSPDNIPFMLVGGGWHFKTGRFLQYDNASNNNLMLSICQAMGLPLTTFGDPRYCTGPLAGLT